MSIDSRYFSCNEIATTVGVDVDTVRAWIVQGELHAFNVAKAGKGEKPRWRVSETTLAEFLQRRSSRPATASPPQKPKPTIPKSQSRQIKFF